MKNIIFLAIAAVGFSLSASSQSTADSIKSKYQLVPMPEPLSIQKAFPAIGSYQLTDAAQGQANINITLDPTSKGLVWVEGLPQGKFKAYLKKSPSTYRILSQKTEDGKQIPEGTLIFNPETSTLNIVFGKEFNDEDPAAVFATVPAATTEVKVKTSKSKTKMTFYTANKIIVSTAETNSSINQE